MIRLLKFAATMIMVAIVRAEPRCFYNMAYEDSNYIDTLSNTLKATKTIGGCYVLVDTDNFGASAAAGAIASLKQNNNTVGCYVSIGTVENWRSDFSKFRSGVDYQPKQWPQWPGEYFIKAGGDGMPTANTVALMKQRLDKLAGYGCGYVEFDNMDIDEGNTMTNIKGAAMRSYNMALCMYTKSKGMKCMAKNTGPSDADDNVFDGLTVESNPSNKNWWGTLHAMNFVRAGKPFAISHYDESTPNACTTVWGYYRGLYKASIGFVCSQSQTKSYVHFVSN